MEDKERKEKEVRDDPRDDELYKVEEIKIEEMAIDGICGVY